MRATPERTRRSGLTFALIQMDVDSVTIWAQIQPIGISQTEV